MRGVPDRALRREFRKRVAHLLRARPDAQRAFLCTVTCAMHDLDHAMAREMAANRTAAVNSFRALRTRALTRNFFCKFVVIIVSLKCHTRYAIVCHMFVKCLTATPLRDSVLR